jgi:hypothetical protein
MDKPLNKQDFFRWTEQQARALRAAASMRIDAPLDWENLARRSRAWAVRTAAKSRAASKR